MDAEVVAAVMREWQSAPVREPLRAALDLAERITLRPLEIGADDLGRWRGVGLDGRALEDAANVAFHFNLINRLADAFDFTRAKGSQLPRIAALLDRAGNPFGGGYPAVPIIVGEGGARRPVEVEAGRRRIFEMEGAVAGETRRAVEGHCARLRGGARPKAEVPEVLVPYLEKLAHHAYRIIDEDVQALKDAGYSEEAIFELTVAGAFGASVVGLERLFGAIAGEV